MKKMQGFLLFLALVLSGFSAGAHAEDIDIYSDNVINAGIPNVMFILFNGADMDASSGSTCTYPDGSSPSAGPTKVIGLLQCALVNAISNLPAGSVNIGIAVVNGFGGNLQATTDQTLGGYHDICNSSGTGGCIVRKLMTMDTAGKASMTAFIKGLKQFNGGSTDASGVALKVNTSSADPASAMQEVWAYYNGKKGGSGTDYSTSILAAGCQHNFVVYIGTSAKGVPTNAGDAGITASQVGATVAQLSQITGTVAFNPNICGMPSYTLASGNDWADEWARLMYQQDGGARNNDNTQNIISYTINVQASTCVTEFPGMLSSMAKNGGGKFFDTTGASALQDALSNILNEVQAVNSVFSSASLPVSVNAEGSYLNQIYLGMFRPDSTGAPRWLGNLKQYQLIKNANNNLVLGDAAGRAAISSAGTGFITPNAVSFWSKKDTTTAPDNAATGGFYVNDLKGVPPSPFDSPDGEVVEKGGAAQQLRLEALTANFGSTEGSSTNPRRLYTYCPSGIACNAALTNSSNAFSTGNLGIAATAFGTGIPVPDKNTVIRWVRGEDNRGDEKGPGVPITVRPSIHGDVLHSRPLVINYGDSRGIVVFYGSNDGVYHAVNGNQTAALGTVAAGDELWGLVLPEHYGQINRLRLNSPEVQFPSTILPTTAKPKNYFVDGPTGAYQKLKADGTIDKAYIFMTMRRGGRFIYALDVSTPTAPVVLWKIDASTPGFGELGQTWSRPRLTLLQGGGSTLSTTPVLVFGAGYDPSEDTEPPGTDVMGRGIFIVNAATGALIWSANPTCTTSATCRNVSGMTFAIPSDVTFVDRDLNGLTDKMYFADLGGNVWRADVSDSSTSNWTVTKLAALGCDTGACAAGTAPRKFFFPPAVLTVKPAGQSGSYDLISAPSGDREHPLKNTSTGSSYNVRDEFFTLVDTGTAVGVPATSNLTLANLFNATSAQYDGSLNGFYLTFATGEKAVNAPLALNGSIFFATNRPVNRSLSCSANLGEAKAYAVSPFLGTAITNVLPGGGLAPSAVSGLITITTTAGTTTTTSEEKFCIGCGISVNADGTKGTCNSALENCNAIMPIAKNMKRTYWYKK